MGILILAGLVGGAFYLGTALKKPELIACTMDTKICPDGTGVGRVPPTCEFASCPTTQPTSTPSSTIDSFSGECEVCGPKGIHNLDGKQCAQGLECKNMDEGIASSVYLCVQPGKSIKTCLEKLD